jgi:hypothetical protein
MVAAGRDPSRRRRGALTAATLIMLMSAGAAVDALAEHAGAWRLIDFVRLAAILLLALVVSVRSTTNFSLARRVPALDDELTRANRASAATWGFWSFFVALLAAYGATLALPVALQELAPAVLVCGAGAAGLRFVFLERRGE